MMWTLMPWDFALVLAVLGVLVPWHGAVRIKQLLARPRLDTADRLALYASTVAFQWLAVAVVAWRCHARRVTAARLGLALPEPKITVATALALSLLLGVSQFLSLLRLARLPANRQGFLHQVAEKVMPQNLIEALAFVALASTVALCEEFLYRGFAFVVLKHAAADSVMFAVLGSSALFALAHIYQGRRGLLLTLLAGILFAAVRAWTASLAPSVAAHLVADLVAGLGAPRYLASPASLEPPAQEHSPHPEEDP